MLRSLIFVPAKETMLNKISSMHADGIIIDLEDSIEDNDKANALGRVDTFLKNNTVLNTIVIRLNRDSFEREAKVLSAYPEIGFMLPKVESIYQYNSCVSLWDKHPVLALIESPLGLLNLNEIAMCNWVDALAFGAEDYTATVNMKNTSKYLYYQKSQIVTYAKAYGKKAFDTPSFSLYSEETFREDVDDSVSLGFDGKLLIHPKHIDYINRAFSVADISYLQDIVKRYESSGQAVTVINGIVYEKMHIQRFKRIIKENGGEII